MPHFHVSGLHALVTFLYIVAVFGALHLAAASFPSNSASQAWTGLGF